MYCTLSVHVLYTVCTCTVHCICKCMYSTNILYVFLLYSSEDGISVELVSTDNQELLSSMLMDVLHPVESLKPCLPPVCQIQSTVW